MFKLNFKTFMIISTILAVFVSTLVISYTAYAIKNTAAADAGKIWENNGTYVYAVVGSNVIGLITAVVALFLA
jgi:hypothetical protein